VPKEVLKHRLDGKFLQHLQPVHLVRRLTSHAYTVWSGALADHNQQSGIPQASGMPQATAGVLRHSFLDVRAFVPSYCQLLGRELYGKGQLASCDQSGSTSRVQMGSRDTQCTF
jgi:hypothetical protein